MSYTTYKEWHEARDKAFYWMCREYLIECANHVISLCPLPEFVKALEILEWFHTNPMDARRRVALQKVYKESFSGKAWERFGNTSTVAGALHQGLQYTLRFALDNPAAMTSGHTLYFVEAVAIATDKLQPLLLDSIEVGVWWENRGRQSETNWQSQLHKKLCPPYYKQFGESWKEYKRVNKVKQEAA
jgi:hypothetical protein